MPSTCHQGCLDFANISLFHHYMSIKHVLSRLCEEIEITGETVCVRNCFLGTYKQFRSHTSLTTCELSRGCSSNGRALALHARSSGIDARRLQFSFQCCFRVIFLSLPIQFSNAWKMKVQIFFLGYQMASPPPTLIPNLTPNLVPHNSDSVGCQQVGS